MAGTAPKETPLRCILNTAFCVEWPPVKFLDQQLNVQAFESSTAQKLGNQRDRSTVVLFLSKPCPKGSQSAAAEVDGQSHRTGTGTEQQQQQQQKQQVPRAMKGVLILCFHVLVLSFQAKVSPLV